MQMDNFFKRIKKLIDEHSGGKPYSFANKAGIPSGTFQAYLAKRLPMPEHLIRIYETYNVNLNWLLTGHGEPHVQKSSESPHVESTGVEPIIKDPQSEFNQNIRESVNKNGDAETIEILRMSNEILNSDTVYSESLAANIRSFYHAIKIENRLDNLELKNSKKNMEIRKSDSSEKTQEILKKRAV